MDESLRISREGFQHVYCESGGARSFVRFSTVNGIIELIETNRFSCGLSNLTGDSRRDLRLTVLQDQIQQVSRNIRVRRNRIEGVR